MKRKYIYILIVICQLTFVNFSFAQPKNISASEIFHRLQGLKNTATVLYIAAHPDDENTRLISYLEKDKHYRVAYMSLTRGDGGQNLIGTEQGMDLGILRTQELLAARSVDGGEQFFSTAYDFGYSKTPEETLKKWDEKKVLSDIITVMNHLQPDIVICRFPTTGEGGHGHHTASAILAEKAFDSLVADYQDEELRMLKVSPSNYYPKKLFWNTFSFGNRNTTSEDQLKIDVGGYNSLLGKSYGEIASEARSMHRCQAFGMERKRGEQLEYFKTLRGKAPQSELMEGIKTDWTRFKNGDVINKKIDVIISSFDYNDPTKSIKDLLKLRLEIIKFSTQNEDCKILKQKLHDIDELILDCAGIYIELKSESPTRVAALNESDSLKFTCSVINRSSNKVLLKSIQGEWYEWKKMLNLILESNKQINSEIKLVQDLDFSSYVSDPYPVYKTFGQSNEIKDGMNTVYSPRIELANKKEMPILALLPEYRPEITCFIEFEVDGQIISIRRLINYKYIDPSYGEIFQPLVFIKPDSIMELEGYIQNQIKYNHIPTQLYYKKKVEPLMFDYLKTSKIKIGYILGAGDKIPEVLSQIGYDVTLLDEMNISTFSLENFDAIVTGVRAYNTQTWLNEYKQKFLKYVEDGGNLIIQYNTSRGVVADIPKPYPFEISRDRVTEEEADVTILKKDHPLLKFPNQITTDDFKNWVQEFGLYFPDKVDEHYEKILSMHDTGESPKENSLLYCTYGKGKYIYTGLSFFRELPAGVEGATKLFVNLLEDNLPAVNCEETIIKMDNKKSKKKKSK